MSIMLGDNELAETSAQLDNLRLGNAKHQETLTEVLAKYGALIESYKRLKSDYEEERESRERYKQMARGQERNPFVLVLVDGDGYIFDDDLVSNGAEGGQRAAHLLDESIKASLRMRGLENCRVMVRVYTNLVGLSKVLSRLKLCGAEKRSLAAFAANFTRSNELFDFVDAGELKENADSKIRALFRQFVDNTQCRHIYFAGCHDVGYINELLPHKNNREKITLVKNYATHPEFTRLGMRLEDFPGIFRTTPVDPSSAPTQPYKAPPTPSKIPASNGTPEQAKAKPCYFYQKGNCKYGDHCANLHVKSTSMNGSYALQDLNSPAANAANWRPNGAENKFVPTSDTEFMRPNHPASQSTPPSADMNFASVLPGANSIPDGFVAINAKGERLDVYMPPVHAEDRARFTQRIAKQKLCNKFYLTGDDHDPSTCGFDHSPIDDSLRNYLRSIAASTPCTRRSACRNLNCLNGHICQKPDCKYRGGKTYCKLPGPIHYVQMGVKECVPGVMPLPHQAKRDDKTVSFNITKDGWGSSSPPLREESEASPRSPMSGVNVTTKSFFGLNLGASEERETPTSYHADDDLAWPDKATLGGGLTDSDLD
jgi:hypothetical protein